MTAPLSPLTARFVHRWFPKPDKQSLKGAANLGALLAKEVPPHP
jgi:hypothetical protein